MASFQPAPYFPAPLEKFSQFDRTTRVWSPDSRLIHSAIDETGPSLMVAYASAAVKPGKMADGLMASWSWR